MKQDNYDPVSRFVSAVVSFFVAVLIRASINNTSEINSSGSKRGRYPIILPYWRMCGHFPIQACRGEGRSVKASAGTAEDNLEID